MSIKIPLTNQEIGTSGLLFTPDHFPEWVAYIAEQLADVSGGASGFDSLVSGYGRIAGADYFAADSSAPQVPATPALAIELSKGVWRVQGQQIETEDGDTLQVPPNMAAPGRYGYVSTYEIEDSDGTFGLEILPANWFDELQPDLSASGLACIGRVVSDVDSVVSIDKSSADVIVPGAVVRDLLETIIAGAGGGGSVVLFGTTIAIAPDDVTSIRSYIDASNATQRAEYLALIQSGGGETIPQPYDRIANEEAITRYIALLSQPQCVVMGQIAVVGPNFGHAQSPEQPDFTPTTGAENELFFDPATGQFGAPSGS